jgi:hypothetical protein
MFITPSFLLIALAVLMAILFIPAILSTKKFQKAMKKFFSKEELIRLVGLFTLLSSFLFLSVHWKFTGGWFMLVPILGWLMLIKGISYIWFPEFTYSIMKKTLLKSEALTGVMAFVELLLAIGLTYVALYIY